MDIANGAAPADAGNTDARPANAQDAKPNLDEFLSNDVFDEEQSVSDEPNDQAPSRDNDAEDPENLFGKPEKKADSENSDEAEKPDQQAKIKFADGSEASIEQIQEWREAGLRTADYTRKTQEVAQQRQQIEARASEVAAHETAVSQALERALAVVEAYVPQPPSHDLAFTDPAAYTQQMAIYQAAIQNVEKITSQKAQLSTEAEKKAQADRGQLVAQERDRLFAAIPELKDDAKREAFNKEMVKAVSVYGFSESDYRQIVDHRLVRVLADAARYQKIKAASAQGKPKPTPGTAPQPPGRRAPVQTGNEVEVALNQAKRTGSKADTQKALDAYFGD